ncbi:MAG: GDP-mannose 4,6-dehydratase [Planctomycetota bacterium]|nr:GDP-mannose 4,6-dehydratase [Planctomycetota bacterium]
MSNSRKIVVLGANSFSGQDFVDLLLDNPRNEVIGISRSPLRSSAFIRHLRRDDLSRFRYFALDMNSDIDRILELLDTKQPQAIVNFAAQSEVAPSWENPHQWFQTNCVALARLVNHLRDKKYLERYLHVSSPEVYGTCVGTVLEDAPVNPSTPYAASKAAADMLLDTYRRQFGFPLLTVRATNVYGARQQLFKIIPRSVLYMKSGRKIPLHGGGQAVKSYIHIRDVSRGELAILDQGQIGEIYHLSPDTGVSIRRVVETVAKRLGVEFAQTVEIVDERPGQDAAYLIDSTKARGELGWSPQIDFASGIEEVVGWVEENWEVLRHEPWGYQHKA